MYLTSLIHRDQLFQITNRWFSGQAWPDDGRMLTEVFIFEQPVVSPTILEIMNDIFRSVHPSPIHFRRITNKDELRHSILVHCEEPDERIRELFQRFRNCAEEYFPRTPVNMILAEGDDGQLSGLTRIKSIRRIADKASRRISDRLSGEINSTARTLAGIRAHEAGIPLERLVSSSSVMAVDFIEAERIVSQSFKTSDIQLTPQDTHIDDVIGFKFVGSPEQLEVVRTAIIHHPRIQIAESEIHIGNYNDTNLLIDIQLPPTGAIIDRLKDQDWTSASRRGLSESVLKHDLPAYVESGARSVRAEVILTSFEELVESEYGRSIHEERTIRQRSTAAYSGRIAQNASYLIEYMLTLAISPQVEVRELPVKLWGRYLPDMVSSIIWNLFGVESSMSVVFNNHLPPSVGV